MTTSLTSQSATLRSFFLLSSWQSAAYLLSHWTRDRSVDRISLPRAVQMLSADAADYLGLHDRGRIQIGQRADINVIDYNRLSLRAPEMVQDLPAKLAGDHSSIGTRDARSTGPSYPNPAQRWMDVVSIEPPTIRRRAGSPAS